MKKEKIDYYLLNTRSKLHDEYSYAHGKWKMLKRFIKFLFSVNDYYFEASKCNNIVITGNMSCEYNEEHNIIEFSYDVSSEKMRKLENFEKVMTASDIKNYGNNE